MSASEFFRFAAEAVERERPDAAAFLRRMAAEHPPAPDPDAIKRTVLRRLWHEHFGGMKRTPAAAAIANGWAAFVPSQWEPAAQHTASVLRAFMGRWRASRMRPDNRRPARPRSRLKFSRRRENDPVPSTVLHFLALRVRCTPGACILAT
jgi:hypothetical protein